jgi:hypothetical protein
VLKKFKKMMYGTGIVVQSEIFISWIRIRIKVKTQQPWRIKIEPGTLTMEALRGSKWSPGRSVDQWSQICFTLMRSRIRIRIHI